MYKRFQPMSSLPCMQTNPASHRMMFPSLSAMQVCCGGFLRPQQPLLPLKDGTAEIFRAVGEANEVREVLRTCLSRGYKFDEVEILHTDAETYIPLIYELLIRPEAELTLDDQGLPVTFAEGIPTRYSKPGRALTAWLAWLREGYMQATVRADDPGWPSGDSRHAIARSSAFPEWRRSSERSESVLGVIGIYPSW